MMRWRQCPGNEGAGTQSILRTVKSAESANLTTAGSNVYVQERGF
jgi:hypothetical protein